jgi:hypothetical protein
VGELAIDEPHPRTDAFRMSERFAKLCQRLSALLLEGSAESERAARSIR